MFNFFLAEKSYGFIVIKREMAPMCRNEVTLTWFKKKLLIFDAVLLL